MAYTWNGMQKISYEVAVELWKVSPREIYLLYSDNTESAVESLSDIEIHHGHGGEFGFEKADATPEED